jgi:precorrin-3B C17-methyltransferase
MSPTANPARGRLSLVSVGPGSPELLTPKAASALQQATDIVTYPLYLQGIEHLAPSATIHPYPLTQERDRAEKAIALATEGRVVCLLSSGDIGVYGMAPLVFELLDAHPTFELEVIPGITAATSCASLLGAPLSHDFATLSLSDLLCPKDWILHRANVLASGDIVTVLYNVQSKGRRELLYHVLDVFLSHRAPSTPCGVVRNAYRPDQTVEIASLAELRKREFDMFTTLVLGNSRTQTRSGFLFGPRGYLGWADEPPRPSKTEPPPGGVWVFSGTHDGNLIAKTISDLGICVTVSTATRTGASQAQKNAPRVNVFPGAIGEIARTALLKQLAPQLIVDATHPFATRIQAQLERIAEATKIPLIRWERPSVPVPEHAVGVASPEAAIAHLPKLGQRILITTGSRDLSLFTKAAPEKDWFCRVMPDAASLDAARNAGIPVSRTLAMVGPFSTALNVALLQDWKITGIITKESGAEGGLNEKLQAAKTLNLPILVIRRPERRLLHAISDLDTLIEAVKTRCTPPAII